MPDNMTVNDIIEVTYRGELYGQTILNLFHYKLIEVGTTTDYVQWCTELAAELNGGGGDLLEKFTDCLTTDYNFEQIRIQKIAVPRMAALGFESLFTTGDVAEAALPPGTSVSIQRSGMHSGRENIGGIRMSAVPPSFVDGGNVSTLGMTTYGLLAETFPNNIVTVPLGTLAPIILNRLVPADSPLIFSANVKSTVRTMSRRVVGRGI